MAAAGPSRHLGALISCLLRIFTTSEHAQGEEGVGGWKSLEAQHLFVTFSSLLGLDPLGSEGRREQGEALGPTVYLQQLPRFVFLLRTWLSWFITQGAVSLLGFAKISL